MSPNAPGDKRAFCPECSAELLTESNCWLCGWKRNKQSVPILLPRRPISFDEVLMWIIQAAVAVMVLIIGVSLLVLGLRKDGLWEPSTALVYWVVALPGVVSLFFVSRKEPTGSRAADVMLSLVMGFAVLFGTLATLMAGIFIALWMVCRPEFR